VSLSYPSVLLAREQVWLNILFSTFASALIYNIARDALAPFTGRTHSAETKAAISEAMSGNKNALGNTSTSKSVFVYDQENVLVKEFPSHTAAAKFLGISKIRVSHLVKNGGRTRSGFRVFSTPLS
jgi:hypothetical protein